MCIRCICGHRIFVAALSWLVQRLLMLISHEFTFVFIRGVDSMSISIQHATHVCPPIPPSSPSVQPQARLSILCGPDMRHIPPSRPSVHPHGCLGQQAQEMIAQANAGSNAQADRRVSGHLSPDCTCTCSFRPGDLVDTFPQYTKDHRFTVVAPISQYTCTITHRRTVVALLVQCACVCILLIL